MHEHAHPGRQNLTALRKGRHAKKLHNNARSWTPHPAREAAKPVYDAVDVL